MNLLLLGCGNMGSAMVEALLRVGGRCQPLALASGLFSFSPKGNNAPPAAGWPPNPALDPAKPDFRLSLFEKIFVFDANAEKAEALKSFGAKPLGSLDDVSKEEPMAVLVAVKPQDIDALLESLRGRFVEESFLISIAAGVRMKRLEKAGLRSIVRVMPNTPAMVGLGASGWLASAAATVEQKRLTVALLESFGVAVEVDNEDQLDAVTALSGSGPGYVFYFLEALVQGGIKVGLSEIVAQQLAIQTVRGAATLAEHRARTLDDLKTLRTQVTSKGGTTEAGIGVFEKEQLNPSIQRGVEAAYRRAKEL